MDVGELTVITTCVEYDDLLKISIKSNLKHFHRWLILTTPSDLGTQKLVEGCQDSRLELVITEAFTYKDAPFNKGLAIEEAFEVCNKSGWFLILDADIILPQKINWEQFEIGNLYTPSRRNVNLPTFSKERELSNDTEFAGYFQLFNSNDQALENVDPWYGTHYEHAGFCDRDFQAMWSECNKIRPDFEVLHLGERDRNWYGRVTPRLDGEEITDQGNRTELTNNLWKKMGWL